MGETRQGRQVWVLFGAFLLAVVDQVAKSAVRARLGMGEEVSLIPNVLSIVLRPNFRGVSWWVPDPGFLGGVVLTCLLAIIAIGAYPVLRFYSEQRRYSRVAEFAALMLIASAAGHLLDGIVGPYTTDWIRVGELPAFNLADLFAYAGIAALLVESWSVHRLSGDRTVQARWQRYKQTRAEFVQYVLHEMWHR